MFIVETSIKINGTYSHVCNTIEEVMLLIQVCITAKGQINLVTSLLNCL